MESAMKTESMLNFFPLNRAAVIHHINITGGVESSDESDEFHSAWQSQSRSSEKNKVRQQDHIQTFVLIIRHLFDGLVKDVLELYLLICFIGI